MSATAAASLVSATPARAATKITYWNHFASPEEFAGLKRVMDQFRQRFPDVALIQETIPNPEYMTKFTAAVMANSRPDVTMVVTERLADMLAAGGLVDLTARINAWPHKADYPPARWAGATANGKLYGVPTYLFIDWAYYRKDWFEQAGIAGPPATLDEFVATAKKLTDPPKNRYGFGLRGGPGGYEFLIDLIQVFGSPLVVDGRNAMDRAKTLAAVKWYAELLTVHKVVPPSAPNDGFRQIMEGFKTGQTAMIWHHTGSLVELVRAMKPAEFGTCAKPTGPTGHFSKVTSCYNGLMKTDNEQAAWEWISFWSEVEPAIAFLDETGYFPANPKVSADPRIAGNPLYRPAVETLSYGKLPPSFSGLAGWSQNVVLPEFQKVLVGQQTAEKAVDAMLKGLDATIN